MGQTKSSATDFGHWFGQYRNWVLAAVTVILVLALLGGFALGKLGIYDPYQEADRLRNDAASQRGLASPVALEAATAAAALAPLPGVAATAAVAVAALQTPVPGDITIPGGAPMVVQAADQVATVSAGVGTAATQVTGLSTQTAALATQENNLALQKDLDAYQTDSLVKTSTLIVQGILGLFVTIALGIATWYLTWRGQQAARDQSFTEGYSDAMARLDATTDADKGVPNVSERAGAIGALRELANQYPQHYWLIASAMAGYLRARTPWPPASGRELQPLPPDQRGDVEAVWTMFKDPPPDDQKSEGQSNRRLDLSGTDLRGANLRNAYLSWADLSRACLHEAHLDDAQLQHAVFNDAHVQRAHFNAAHLENASFRNAEVEHANFSGAHVEETNFQTAIGLSMPQLATASEWGRNARAPSKWDENWWKAYREPKITR